MKRIKRSATVTLCPEGSQVLASRSIEQMVDLGDARIDPLMTEDLFNHKVTTMTGDTYFVFAEEVDEGKERFEKAREASQLICRLARACSLLEESLDWVGRVNSSVCEDVLSEHLQRRIARFLGEMRQ